MNQVLVRSKSAMYRSKSGLTNGQDKVLFAVSSRPVEVESRFSIVLRVSLVISNIVFVLSFGPHRGGFQAQSLQLAPVVYPNRYVSCAAFIYMFNAAERRLTK